MRIGVLGTGDVGQALASGFAKFGHQVTMGARDAANPKAKAWAGQAGKGAAHGTFADAAAQADVVVLATLGSAAEDVLRLAGLERLAGKVLIDTTNPLSFKPQALPELFVGHTDSLGERVQRWAPTARVVKAFNIVGNAHMVQPQFRGGPPDMFICGNDEPAKQTVTEILTQFGWSTIDIGGIEGSRYLEAMCLVWVLHGIKSGSWNHAFKMLRG